MSNDLITIGIPCFNAADTIQRAIRSAIAQNWPNTEIIIVDDASSDTSTQVIEETIRDIPNARLIVHEQNKGPAGTRNTIIENTAGEFIAFFDDDDESDPERLEKQHQRFLSYEQETQETLIACYASGQRLYPNGYKLKLEAIGSKPDIPHGPDMADRLLFYGGKKGFFYGSGTPTCSLMARKKTFETVGNFDPAFRRVEDIDFAVRLALAGGHFIGCPENLFIQHATEGHDKSHAKNLEAELQLAQKHKDYLEKVGKYYYAWQWPKIRYYHFCKQYAHMALALLNLWFRHPVRVLSHLFCTGPARLAHERKMRKKTPA